MNVPDILGQRLWTLGVKGGNEICNQVRFSADGSMVSLQGRLDIRWVLHESFLALEDLDGEIVMRFDTLEKDFDGYYSLIASTDETSPSAMVHSLREDRDRLRKLTHAATEAKDNLIIVRAGSKSLHPHWMSEGSRNWDLIVSSFADDVALGGADYVSHARGPKWIPLHNLIRKNIEIISKYKYICLADDDLLAQTSTWNAIFETCKAHDLLLAQPALTVDSFFSHLITIRKSGSHIRFTNFVEVMCPVFSQQALQACLQTMGDDSLYGWGQDYIWPRILGYPTDRIGIIDTFPVKHTRPIGHATDQRNAFTKMFGLLQAYGLSGQPPFVTFGELSDAHGSQADWIEPQAMSA